MTLNTSMCFLWKQQPSQCNPATNNLCLHQPYLTTHDGNNQDYDGYTVEILGLTHVRTPSQIVMKLLLMSTKAPKEIVQLQLLKDTCKNSFMVQYFCESYYLLAEDCHTLDEYAMQLTDKILLSTGDEKMIHPHDDLSCKDMDMYIIRDVLSNDEWEFLWIDMMVYSKAVTTINDVTSTLISVNPMEKIVTSKPYIWMMWWQGWEFSPPIAQKCVESWRKHHPDWPLILLDKDNVNNYFSIHQYLPHLNLTHTVGDPVVHYSGIIRFGLLYHYGGMWADATVMCHKPMESFIYNPVIGFFAFDNTLRLMISTWFITSIANSYIGQRMFEETIKYWMNKDEADDYFWASNLFISLYQVSINDATEYMCLNL